MDPQLAIKISVILYWSALLIYTSYWIVGFMGRGVRFYVLLGGVVLHTASIIFSNRLLSPPPEKYLAIAAAKELVHKA